MKEVPENLGLRLRRARTARNITLDNLSQATGISASTLSRLETGSRKPTLELLLPLAQAFRLTLDDLVGAPQMGDPRIHPRPVRRNGMTIVPLSHIPGPQQAVKMIIPTDKSTPRLTRHEGYAWMYVLNGELRLIVGDHDSILLPGQAAKFDTRTAHWFGSTGRGPVEILSLLGLRRACNGRGVFDAATPRPNAGCITNHGATTVTNPIETAGINHGSLTHFESASNKATPKPEPIA
ncbi:helix-turn-helix domain-containing protein [Corynebacterium sp. 4HC-13]|uniref:Helix-turn-helix domain-containing protein n=1 Tax=Corynebacterium anserum TaxID=2684406 RepID=A0A7G7YPE9_9CORY|nr:helix-turn-helix domain-containing protein [Corynebacterium anserum]QNH96369.1 helix-turn-helix domain-containing protein [Corynebacterium anserum]